MTQIIKDVHSPFRVAAIAVFISILCPTLFQDGMFMDGILYASVGKNLSQGIGSWWHPHFSNTFMTDYHQQPLMLFWLQSLFFRFLGTGFWVERFYSLLVAIGNAFVISLLWKKIFADKSDQRSFNWLPVLFWITIPVCSFTFINNLEEGTMSIFTLSAACFIVSSLTRAKPAYLMLMLAGLLILCSALTKGIQGTFPLAVVFFYWLVFKSISFREMLKYSAVVACVPLIIFALLLTNHTIYESFRSYYYDRLYFTFNNQGAQTTGMHFSLFFRLLQELIPAFSLLLIVFFVSKIKPGKWQLHQDEKRYAIFFLLLGLSAALPLMITLEQRSFYLTTSLPYFSLSLSILALPGLAKLFWGIKLQSIGMKIFLYSSTLVILSASTSTVINFGEPKRDITELKDLKIITAETGTGIIIGTTTELFGHWSLQGYCMRYYNVSLDEEPASDRKYFLVSKNASFPTQEGYMKVNIPLEKFDLFVKRVNAEIM